MNVLEYNKVYVTAKNPQNSLAANKNLLAINNL